MVVANARQALAAGFNGSGDGGGRVEDRARRLFTHVQLWARNRPHAAIAKKGRQQWLLSDDVIERAHEMFFAYQGEEGQSNKWPEAWVKDIKAAWQRGDAVFRNAFRSFSGGKNYEEWVNGIEVDSLAVISIQDRRPAQG